MAEGASPGESNKENEGANERAKSKLKQPGCAPSKRAHIHTHTYTWITSILNPSPNFNHHHHHLPLLALFFYTLQSPCTHLKRATQMNTRREKKKNTPESGSFFSDPCNAQGSTSHIANSRTHHPSQPDSIACPLSYFSLSPIAPLLCPSTHSVGRTAATHNIKNLKRSRRHPRGARASSLDT